MIFFLLYYTKKTIFFNGAKILNDRFFYIIPNKNIFVMVQNSQEFFPFILYQKNYFFLWYKILNDFFLLYYTKKTIFFNGTKILNDCFFLYYTNKNIIFSMEQNSQ